MWWTDETTDQLRDLAALGLSATRISVAFKTNLKLDLSRNAIIGRAHRSGIRIGRTTQQVDEEAQRAVAVLKARQSWSEQDLDTLRAMIADRHTIASIASALGRRKAIVCEKIRELGIRPARQVKKRKSPPIVSEFPTLPPKLVLAAEHTPTGAEPVSFEESGEFVCKAFLPGEPLGPEGLVCGNPTDPGSTYRFCPSCCETFFAAHQPRPPRADDKTTFMFPKKARAA